jgi:hypothetical protein
MPDNHLDARTRIIAKEFEAKVSRFQGFRVSRFTGAGSSWKP